MVYNSNPVAVAPDSEKVLAGFAREDLFTVVVLVLMPALLGVKEPTLGSTVLALGITAPVRVAHWDR